jgi:uncharacterized protein YukJ
MDDNGRPRTTAKDDGFGFLPQKGFFIVSQTRTDSI